MSSKVEIGTTFLAEAPYPEPPRKQEVTAAKAKGFWALLTDPNVFVPNTNFTAAANSLQSVSRICGKLTRIVNAASTSVVLVNAARNNVPGFALMVGLGVITQAAQNAGINPNDIVGSAIQRANEIITSPMRFLENAFRAQVHSQASFTSSGIADVFGALRSVSNLLTACKTFTDLISGGVTARLGPNADNTVAGARLRAAGINISGDQIRRGLSVVTDAMRRLGTLWEPNEVDLIGTPNGLVLSLQNQGIADAVGLRQPLLDQGVFIDDEDDVRGANPLILLEALKTIQGKELEIIIQRTSAVPFVRASILTAADLCRGDLLIGQDALDNIPYGTLVNFGQQIASLGIKNRATWEQIADVLDDLDLPDIGLIDNPSFPSDMANLAPYLGAGSGLFGDATMFDFLGTAAGFAHTEAYQRLSAANDRLENTAEGQALIVALEFYELHEDPADPLNNTAENNLIAALEAVKTSPDPVVRQAVEEANKSILDSALQLVSEITNAIATGYGIYTTIQVLVTAAIAISEAIASAAASLGSPGSTVATKAATQAGLVQAAAFPEGWFKFSGGLKAVFQFVGQIASAIADATGFTGILQAIANPATQGGQAILAMQAEARNAQTLAKVGMKIPSVDLDDEAAKRRARFGFGLTTEQQLLIASYGREKGLGVNQIEELLFVNAYYGYQRHFFENVVGLVEGTRARVAQQAGLV